MAYRADIEIGVKGAQKLEEIKKKIQSIDQKVDQVNARWKKIRSGIPTKEFGEVNKKLQKTTALQARANALAAATEKRLRGQNSVTNGLLRLNKAVLNAARSEAQARGESAANQRALNRELAKTQQYSKAIGPEPARGGRSTGRSKIGRAVGAGLSTVNLPGQDIAQAAFLGSLAGPKGAAIAAGIAVVAKGVEGLVRLGPEVAKTEAQLSKLEIALRGILGSKSEEGFKAIDRAARDFNQPILDATKNFTQLSAAATANGNSVKQTETLYRALSAATKATGGDAQDLSGVLRAATQVISKGVVRSEELRGQIGDRLPGAFQLFAQATNRSAEELQKALEQGEVSADEFVTTFSNFILNKFEPAALRIGDSPAEAGARLTKALEDANRAAGPLLLALGAKFQDFATEALKALTPLLEGLNQAFNLDKRTARGYARDLKELADLDKQITTQENFQKKAIGNQAKGRIDDVIGKLEQRRGSVIRDINDYLANVKSPKALTPLKPTPTPDDPKGKGKADKAAERAAREEERLQERLAALRIELNLIAANADFKQKITAAEIAGNKELAIRLKAQQDINTIQANGEKTLIGIDDIREKNLERQKTAAKINAANVNFAAELAVFEDQKQKAFDEQIESLNFQYAILTATTVEEQKRLEIAQQMAALEGKDFTPEQLDQIKAAKERLDLGPIQTYLNELQRGLSDTESMVVSLAQSVESSLATAMSSAVQTLITGTGSVKEAFSDMFAGIGKAFIDMATQMLAQQAIFFLLKALGGGFGGGGGGDIFADIASRGGLRMAEGGYVTGPTNALIGEGGEPEYVIPESKMRESMGRYSRGSRGNSVIPANGGGGGASGGGTATLAPIDVRYTVERINSVDYVTADQFQAGMREAASSGARQGEQRALSTLRQNTTQRRRIGI